MRSVKTAIRADQFFDAMLDMTEWQGVQGIQPEFSNFLRQKNGDCIFHVMFAENDEAENFAKHFGGSLAAEGHPFSDIGNPRPNVWAHRRVLPASSLN